eukprot:jgi/Bigna1/69607/fgenesh1_pg.9_\
MGGMALRRIEGPRRRTSGKESRAGEWEAAYSVPYVLYRDVIIDMKSRGEWGEAIDGGRIRAVDRDNCSDDINLEDAELEFESSDSEAELASHEPPRIKDLDIRKKYAPLLALSSTEEEAIRELGHTSKLIDDFGAVNLDAKDTTTPGLQETIERLRQLQLQTTSGGSGTTRKTRLKQESRSSSIDAGVEGVSSMRGHGNHNGDETGKGSDNTITTKNESATAPYVPQGEEADDSSEIIQSIYREANELFGNDTHPMNDTSKGKEILAKMLSEVSIGDDKDYVQALKNGELSGLQYRYGGDDHDLGNGETGSTSQNLSAHANITAGYYSELLARLGVGAERKRNGKILIHDPTAGRADGEDDDIEEDDDDDEDEYGDDA